MTDFLSILDGPKRDPVAFAPGPATRNVTAYGAAALADEVRNLLAVPIGQGRNDQLNRSAVKMGGLIAAGALDVDTVTRALGEADGPLGLDYKATRDTIASGLKFGMQQARHIDDRRTPSTRGSFAPSDDPLDYVAPSSGTTGSASAASGDAGTAPTLEPTPDSPSAEAERLDALVRERLPLVDWYAAFTGKTDVEWIVEPFLPARRLIAFYSPPKVGKSLLMLELAYKISVGGDVIGVTVPRAYRVLYVDFENDIQGDIVPRLTSMGADPTQLDGLSYLTLPTLAALDSEKGGAELLAAVHTYASEVVVVDTVSRSIEGEENENDTWLKFYRHTGLRLKQAGVSMVRLDHTGKDETRGQRGGSAKGGDVDAVWRLSQLGPEQLRLECEMSRFPIPAAEKIISLERREDPLRHVVDLSGDNLVALAVLCCDDANLPLQAGWQKVRALCASKNIKIGQDRCGRVQAIRRQRAEPTSTTPLHGLGQ